MSSAWSTPLRAFATQTAVMTIIGLGLAAPASAAPSDAPHGGGNDTAAAAHADAAHKQATQEPARTGPSKSTSASTGSDHAKGNAGTSGEYNKPQPLSNADQNGGGANGQCPGGAYCSTRSGLASMNGKGDGQATGKPCAGCVGRADNKNPQGQRPNGTDHNAGYECDRNQGIGQTNPAHTGCTTPAVTTRTCPDGSPLPASGNVLECGKATTRTCPDGSPLPASGDVAECEGEVGGVDTDVPGSRPEVKGVQRVVPPAGVELQRPPASAPQVLPGAAVLPATGATGLVSVLSALAVGMLGLGAGLLLYRRVSAG